MTDPEIEKRLEEMIDSSSVERVLDCLARICSEKADHILSNYNDEVTSKAWNNLSDSIHKVETGGL